MRGKDHLHYLIHSLSKSEKRYFTLDAQKSGRKHSRYLELFRFINKQAEYDEAALKKKFGKSLADDKGRLYEALLSSLRDYQSRKSYKTRIKELLTDAKILFERKLYEQSENRLSEAKALALELQDHLAVLEINLRQRQLIKEYQHKDYAEQVAQLIAEKEHHLKIVKEEFWLQDNYDSLSVDYVRYHNKLDKEKLEALQAKYQPILSYDYKNASFFSTWRYHRTLALYHRLTENNEEEFEEFEKSAKLWQQFPLILAENYFLYLGDAFNILSLSSRNPQRFHEIPELIENLDQERQKKISQQAQGLLFQRITLYKLLYLINSKSPANSSELAKIEEGLNHYQITPSTEFTILINCTFLLFLNDEYATCLNWLKKIQQLQKKARLLRKDIQNNSRIIQLMATYRIGILEEVENLIRAGKRHFNMQKGSRTQQELYLMLSKTISKSYSISTSREQRQLFQSLYDNVSKLNKKFSGGINEIILLWIESIINNKPISEIRKSQEDII